MRRALPAAFVAVAFLAGCGDKPTGSAAPPPERPAEIRPDLVPATIAGLAATLEDVTALEKQAGPSSYLASTRLWGLRDGKKLRATIQVGRFVADSRPHDEAFQRRIVAQVGETAPRPRHLGRHVVYVTSTNQQPVYVWFENAALLVLSVARDHPTPRQLLRQALELQP